MPDTPAARVPTPDDAAPALADERLAWSPPTLSPLRVGRTAFDGTGEADQSASGDS
ncbi:MAG TPA: hypothetical protein VF755_01795 [Catenuloplanes sp.]|jgi:hypothetical protein